MTAEKTYDFYFSSRRKQELIAENRQRNMTYAPAYFNGREYTERVAAGETPAYRYADLVKVGTGTNKNISYK